MNRTTEPAHEENHTCPELTDGDKRLMQALNFWLEGVFLIVVAFLGIIGNFLASLILARKQMRNSFNILLVALALFDTTYLVSLTMLCQGCAKLTDFECFFGFHFYFEFFPRYWKFTKKVI